MHVILFCFFASCLKFSLHWEAQFVYYKSYLQRIVMFYCCCSVFFRDCKDCKVVVACQQFRCVCLIDISNARMKIFCCSSLYPMVVHSFSSNTCSESLCGAACKNETGVKFTPRSTIFWWVTITNYNLFYFLELVIVRRWTSFYVVLLNPLLSRQVEWNLLAISIFTLNLKVRKLPLGWTGWSTSIQTWF